MAVPSIEDEVEYLRRELETRFQLPPLEIAANLPSAQDVLSASREAVTPQHKFLFVNAVLGIAGSSIAVLHFRRRVMLRVHNCSLNIFTKRSSNVGSKRSGGVSQMLSSKPEDLSLSSASFPTQEWSEMCFKKRTLFEKPLPEVVGGNLYASYLVERAARKANPPQWRFSTFAKLLFGEPERQKSPVLTLPRIQHHRAVLKSIANQISAVAAEGFIVEAIGCEPVISERFVVALTCEDPRDAFFFKTRSMVTREDILERIAHEEQETKQRKAEQRAQVPQEAHLSSNPESGNAAAVSPDPSPKNRRFSALHIDKEFRQDSVRLETIRRIAMEYRANPWKFEVVELAIPLRRRGPF
jgi:hypothetical protein